MILVDHNDFEIFFQSKKKLFILRAYKTKRAQDVSPYYVKLSTQKQGSWCTDKEHCLWTVWKILKNKLSNEEYEETRLEYSKDCIKSI